MCYGDGGGWVKTWTPREHRGHRGLHGLGERFGVIREVNVLKRQFSAEEGNANLR